MFTMPKTKYGQYVVTELKIPPEKQRIAAEYAKFATRILWLDENVVPGAFHMNTAWYLKPNTAVEPKSHTHDTDEIIGFFSGDYKQQYDLGGEIEMWLEDQQFILDKSTLIFVPAGMVHCPLKILRREIKE